MEGLKPHQMRNIGHSVASTAIKLYTSQRSRMTLPRETFVKNYARQDKTSKEAFRTAPTARAYFWKGVDDALKGELHLCPDRHGSQVCCNSSN